MIRRASPSLLVSVATTAIALSTSPLSRAAPPDKTACLAAYVDGQTLRKRGALVDARAALGICARDPCPAALHDDCAAWLADVEARLPSVTLGAVDWDGRARANARVVVDGAAIADGTGRLELEPGEHVFQFVVPGRAPVDVRVTLGERERRRAIVARFEPPPGSALAPRPSRPSRPPPWACMALGGVALAATSAFAYFASSGWSRWNACDGGRCSLDDASYVSARWYAADAAAGVAVVSVVLAAYLYFTRPADGVER